MRLKTFKGGIHPPDYKNLTRDKQIKQVKTSKEMVYPLSQHIGKPAIPCVKVNDQVTCGQIIANGQGYVSANIISAISGTVKAIEKRLSPNGTYQEAIVITNDELYTTDYVEHKNEISEFSDKMILEKIRQCGIVGLGGAGFPTHVKLDYKDKTKIKYIIINGAECEPFLSSDHRLMLERYEQLLGGIKIILKLFPNAKGYIAIEDNKKDAIKLLKEKNDDNRIEVFPLKTKYPQGGERMLVYVITGKKLNSKMLPGDVGCIVDNVATTIAIYNAVTYNRPLIQKVMTITGSGIKHPTVVEARIGTNLADIIEQCGNIQGDVLKIVSGGPMMGQSLISINVPITKTSSGIIVLTDKEIQITKPGPCIHCGRCVKACPSHLVPQMMDHAAKNNDVVKFRQLNGMECMECGCCSYVCPAHKNLTQEFKKMKRLVIKDRKKEE